MKPHIHCLVIQHDESDFMSLTISTNACRAGERTIVEWLSVIHKQITEVLDKVGEEFGMRDEWVITKHHYVGNNMYEFDLEKENALIMPFPHIVANALYKKFGWGK